MTLTLTVDSAAWNRRVDEMAARIDGIVPVVKGNGYGFGRDWLAERAALLSPVIAVGTVFEATSIPSNYSAVVLTPTLHVPNDLPAHAILTIGSMEHLEAARGLPSRRVIIKIRSSMQRFGFAVHDVHDAIDACRAHHLDIAGVSIHPPLHGTSAQHRSEIESLISYIDPVHPIWVSHIDVADYDDMCIAYPHFNWYLRLGTQLWHDAKDEISLSTDVLDIVPIESDTVAGYRGVPVPAGSRLVIVGCGSSHGVVPLADGRSPFHFEKQRLQLLEPPHMHSSMCVVGRQESCPRVGDSIDVQRPLTMTSVDVIHWR